MTIGAFFLKSPLLANQIISLKTKKGEDKYPSVFPKPRYVQSIGLDVLAGQITPRNAYLTHDNHSCSNTNTIIQKIVITMNDLNDNDDNNEISHTSQKCKTLILEGF